MVSFHGALNNTKCCWPFTVVKQLKIGYQDTIGKTIICANVKVGREYSVGSVESILWCHFTGALNNAECC